MYQGSSYIVPAPLVFAFMPLEADDGSPFVTAIVEGKPCLFVFAFRSGGRATP